MRLQRPRFNRLAYMATVTPITLGLIVPGAWAQTVLGGLDERAPRKTPTMSTRNVSPTQPETIAHGDAVLEIGSDALNETTEISIMELDDDDIAALNTGMTNVTRGKRAGYRFLPHGTKFKKNVFVRIPYDEDLIPEGLSEQDIMTFFFDEELGRWVALERVEIDTKKREIVSATDHFTDIINATITVPDHPLPQSFNPNSIKDLKIADPSAGINLIEPPAADNQGDARLSYPIEIPPGRDGLQPELAISYNSSAGNGWLGVGWDLQAPSITVDTRWGVPRYGMLADASGDLVYTGLETETYLLNGEQLTPVAHRGELQAREPDKTFHTRVEGQFRKIIRHGDHPSEYWWEVFERDGTRFLYGGGPDTGGPTVNSTLSDAYGNVFLWALREIRDPNGNFVRFRCERVTDIQPSGSAPGFELYVTRITYTGHGTDEGPYEVVFVRDSELGEPQRPDVKIDCRGGFKRVTVDRLRQIDVFFDGDLIRRYELEYELGQFEKSLLTQIIQFGEDGVTEFNRHRFDYFDEVSTLNSGVLNGFECFPDEDANDCVPAIDDATTLSGEGLLLTGVRSTALDADVASHKNTHGSAGCSFFGGFLGFGGRKSKSSSDSATELTLIDLNGDGLPDQVYEIDDRFFFRPNTGAPESAPSFGEEIELTSLSEIESRIRKEHSSTRTYGGSVTIGIGISGEKSRTKTRGEIYLTDVDSDGLPDLVDHGTVYFNRLKQRGDSDCDTVCETDCEVPTFCSESLVPLTLGAPSNGNGLIQNPNADRAEQEMTFHLVDPIRRWVAPYAGIIEITGDVRLVSHPPADYSTADGVRVSVQHNGSELWSATIDDPHDDSPREISGLGTVPVAAGDRIYFRVNSINDGAFDEVEFNPSIRYNGTDQAQVDENGLPLYAFNAGSDYAYGGRRLVYVAPANGSAMLSGSLDKLTATTDDIRLTVRKGFPISSLIHEQTITRDQSGTFPIHVAFDVNAGEALRIHIEADTRVDLTAVSFAPQLEYTLVDGNPPPQLPNGEPAFVFYPPVTMQIYPRNAFSTPYVPYEVPISGLLQVNWSLATTLFTGNLTTDVTLAIKRSGQLLAKERVAVRNGTIIGTSSLGTIIPVSAGDKLYFVASTPTAESVSQVLLKLNVKQPRVAYVPFGSLTSIPFDFHLGIADDEAFGGGFRYWWYGEYNSDVGRGEGGGLPSTCADGIDNDGDGVADLSDPACVLPIDEARLRVPTTDMDPVLRQFMQMMPFTECRSTLTPSAECPEGGDLATHWRAQDQEAWIGSSEMSASRLGENYLDFPDGSALGGGRGIIRHGGAKATSEELSFLVIGGGSSSGTNWSDVDFFDFNGDRYPDVVGNGKVQATLPNGGLDAHRIQVGVFGHVREGTSETDNVSLGATKSLQISDAEGDLERIKPEKPAYNLSAGVTGSCGHFDSEWDHVDINGDGLPDYVRRTDAGLLVRLNLGYRFAEQDEIWSTETTLRHQETLLGGLSLGLGGEFGNSDASIGIGGGVSLTKSTAATEQDLIDVNGDGLTDIVFKELDEGFLGCARLELTSNSNTLSVRFNTGSGFTGPLTLTGAMGRPLMSRVTVDRTVGANASVGFPVGPGFCSVGGGHSRGRSLGSSKTMLSDFDGDGYADHIYSDTAGNVEIALNEHGKTNLLRTIYRPLGAVITLDYERDGNTIAMPQSRWVLSRLEVHDGHPGDGVDVMVTTYAYNNPFFDRVERTFYGYGQVIEDQRNNSDGDSVYRSVVRTYNTTSFYTKGLLVSEVVTDGLNRPFTETLNTYFIRDVINNVDTEPQTSFGKQLLASTTATVFPMLVRTDEHFHEGMSGPPGKSSFLRYQYDSVGNIVEFFDAGDVGDQDDLLATIQYSNEHVSCVDNYIVDVATRIVVTHDGDVLRDREATVDCKTGNVLHVRKYLDPTDRVDPSKIAITDLTYFPNGNLKTVTGPFNKNSERYHVELEYDTDTQTHVTLVRDAFGYASSSAYNLKYGLDLSTTDINGNRTSRTYDIFGRVETVTGPYQQAGGIPTLRFEYHHDAAIPWSLTKHIDEFRDLADPIESVMFVDGLGRELQTKKDATIHVGPMVPAEERMIVSGRLTFDHAGRTVEGYYPVLEPLGTPGAFNFAYDDSALPTKHEYDVLDRTTMITFPDQTSLATDYGFGADRAGLLQFEIIVIDANGVERRTYRDVRNLVTSVREINDGGADVIWTSYEHDPIKQLVGVVDDHSNVTRMSYDNFGRTIEIDNPDTGVSRMSYDLADNLVATVTANLRDVGEQISYDYEFTRLSSITYPQFPENNVAYTYGAAGAPFNRVGRRVVVTDESGSEESFYGKLGEVVKTVKRVASDTPPGSIDTYTTEYTYDTWNRIQQIRYPDGEVLTYRYDSGGSVRASAGLKNGVEFPYLARLEYDRFGQRVFMLTQNGVETTYAYDPADRRLAVLTAGVTGSPPFQNVNYTYDDVGNVLQTVNDVPASRPNESGGPVQHNYQYDDLYRLVSANGHHDYASNKSSRYSLNMTYDTIHNITHKDQVHERVTPGGKAIRQRRTTYAWSYGYGSSRPHAPIDIGDRTYSYDANGNQVGWEHNRNGTRRTIEWDEENRIQSISDNGHRTTYKYDHSGERVTKRGPQGETAYVNQYFTVRNGTIATKHIYAGTTRIASKLSHSHMRPNTNFLYFYHPDHLGSANYVTDVDGALFEHLQYFPFGEAWVEEQSNTQRAPYRFTSKELDEEVGLYYFSARYYDPRVSLFQSPDPIFAELINRFEPKKMNVYAYALHHPLQFTDPSGLDERSEARARIFRLARSEDTEDRQRAAELIVRTYFRWPRTLKKVIYDPNRTGLVTRGFTKQGAKQIIIVGPDFFDQTVIPTGYRYAGKTKFEAYFVKRVRTLRHEVEHVIQKSISPIVSGRYVGTGPNRRNPLREFLAQYVELTAEIPGVRQYNKRETREQITGDLSAESYWNQMSRQERSAHADKYRHIQRLKQWATQRGRTPRPTP